MPDHQEIPETIRTFLATPGHPWSHDLSDVATAYTALCREANERLRRCGDYLRRGMRSEAVHLALCQPTLVPLVDSLKLSDLPAWSRACVANGVPAPPELLTEQLPQLEAATEIEQRLEPLLARHRLLSLAKAPIRDRMEVLVPLHEKDPANPVWVENLRTLGAVRLKQIRAEAQSAYKTKDLALLEQLSAEVEGKQWQIDVPDDLRRGVERAVGFLRLEAAKAQLRPLLAELKAAHGENDYDRAAPILQQWQQIIESRQMVLPGALQEAVRPIIAWITAEERRRTQEQKMQRMRPALENTEQIFRQGQRRHTLLTVLILLGVLAAVGALVYFYAPLIGRR
jgi:hypothetical protein